MDDDEIRVEHHTDTPTDGSKCLFCLDPLEAPYVVIYLVSATGFHIKADDSCWKQLMNLVDTAINGVEGVIVH